MLELPGNLRVPGAPHSDPVRNVTDCKLGLWNCEGIRKKMNVLSEADLTIYDIFVFTETWETQPLSMLRLNVIQSLARKTEGPGRQSGGVAVFDITEPKNATYGCAEDDIVVLNADNCVIISPSLLLNTVEYKLAHFSSWIRSDVPTVQCRELNAPLYKPDSKRTTSLLQTLGTWGLRLITEPHIPTFVAQ